MGLIVNFYFLFDIDFIQFGIKNCKRYWRQRYSSSFICERKYQFTLKRFINLESVWTGFFYFLEALVIYEWKLYSLLKA